MAVHAITARRVSEVWQRLERVPDPELDEPITEMGFVEAVRVGEAADVEVEFRLPTYWCSPNFAFLMADGIRREVGSLDWVASVRVTLHDHMYAEEMNAGVNAGRDFSEIFSELSNGSDLDEIRAVFRGKAFKKRQEAVLQSLKEAGIGSAAIVSMTLGALAAAVGGGDSGMRQQRRYREAMVACGLAAADDDPAFRTLSGQPIAAAQLDAYLADLRAVRINMEFSGALCRRLRSARYKEVVRHPDGAASGAAPMGGG